MSTIRGLSLHSSYTTIPMGKACIILAMLILAGPSEIYIPCCTVLKNN